MSDFKEQILADAFVQTCYIYCSRETEKQIEQMADQIGVPKDRKHLLAISSIVVGCRNAALKGGELIAIPMNRNDYSQTPASHDAFRKVKDKLLENGLLKQEVGHSKGHSAVYRNCSIPIEGKFEALPVGPTIVREAKKPGASKGKKLCRKKCITKFGSDFSFEEKRIDELNKFLRHHPLNFQEEVFWSGFRRIFNEGRMDRGGRLYGDWQQLNEEQRLACEIDGEPVVEIDITACFLFIILATEGEHLLSDDPYSEVSWVQDSLTRQACKSLATSHISKDGGLTKFPQGFRKKHGIAADTKLEDLLNPILETFQALNSSTLPGLEVMYKESECILEAIENLAVLGIPSYPVHDCLIVKQGDEETTIQVLSSMLIEHFGSAPPLTVSRADGTQEKITPSLASGDHREAA